MGNAVDISKLWCDPTYSDLVLKYKTMEWHCHKCIVFPRSRIIREMAQEDDTEEDGKTCIRLRMGLIEHRCIYLMVQTMYSLDQRDFSSCSPEEIVTMLDLAAQEGLSDLQDMAYKALLPEDRNSVEEWEVMGVLHQMRESEQPATVSKADDLELAWMPHLLRRSDDREGVSDHIVNKYFDALEVREKANVHNVVSCTLPPSVARNMPPPRSPEPIISSPASQSSVSPEQRTPAVPKKKMPRKKMPHGLASQQSASLMQGENETQNTYAGEMELEGTKGKKRVRFERPKDHDEDDEEADVKPKRTKRDSEERNEEPEAAPKRQKRVARAQGKGEESDIKPERSAGKE